jgi:hypothetical protein
VMAAGPADLVARGHHARFGRGSGSRR